jgi:hypothetical protein
MKLLARFRRPAAGRLAGRLSEVEADLTALSQTTEQDFLAVGSRLEHILHHAREEAGKLACIQGPSPGGGRSALTEFLKQAGGACDQSGEATDADHRFAELSPLVRMAGQPLQELLDMVRMLRVLRVATLMESSRLGAQSGNFEALAVEVRNLADGIEQKAGSLLDVRDELTALLVRAQAEASGQQRRQQQEMVRLTSECAAGAAELQRERDQVAELSAWAQRDYEQVATSVSAMVQNLQAHDSVRQRFDHIVGALAEIREGHGGGREVELQSAQLHQAAHAFVTAVEQIRTKLDLVKETGLGYRSLAEQCRAGESGELEAHVLAIGTAMAAVAQSQKELSSVAQEVQHACARMFGFVCDIEVLGERLLRLALNAEVQAVQLQVAGAVMESVAENIRLVSQSASESARAAGAALRALEAPAGQLAEAFRFDTAGDVAIQDHARDAVAEIRSSRIQARQVLDSVTQGGEALAMEIAALREGIRAGETVEQVTGECQRKLSTVAAAMSGGTAAASVETSASYTMHAERAVHASFVTGSGSAGMPAALASLDSSLGDNVELF